MATDIVPPPTTAGAAMPAGVMAPFAGSSSPMGWLLCDGSSLLRSSYPDLFAAIGTAFGAVDGMHFTIPDTRGRFLVGLNVADPAWDVLGETGGATSAAPSAHLVTQPNAHAVTQPNAHAVTQPNAHAVTQPNDHAAHTHTGPSHTHTGPGHSHTDFFSNLGHSHPVAATHQHELPFSTTGTATHFSQGNVFGTGTSRAATSSWSKVAASTSQTVSLSQAVSPGATDTKVFLDGTTSTDGTGATGAAGTGATGNPSATLAHAGTAVDAHAGTAVDAHAGTAVDAHAGTAVAAHSAIATVPPYLAANYIIKT